MTRLRRAYDGINRWARESVAAGVLLAVALGCLVLLAFAAWGGE